MKPILLLTVILFALNINAQPIGIAAGSISSSGIGGSFQHQFHQKFAIGYGAKYMNLKPVLTFKFNDVQVKTRIPEAFAQLEIFAKWFPRGYTGPNGFEKNRVFVRTGIAFRTNSTYNTHSKFKKTEIISDFIPPIVSTGVADIYVVTQKIQPFISLGYMKIKRSKKITYSAEMGFYYHGFPTSTITSSGDIPLNGSNRDNVEKGISYLVVKPFLNFEVGFKL